MRVTVWGEYFQERYDEAVSVHYPHGIHEAIADGLRLRLGNGWTVGTAAQDEPEHGLPAEVLDATDVLVWWGHLRHEAIVDSVADRVYQRVLSGMGLIVLHSALESKPFVRLMGTSCRTARWRQGTDREAVWTVNPSHPIAQGIAPVFVIAADEMYSEYFDIPQPEELVFISSFSGGEVFRSGCCFVRGNGRIFYFRPGHETYPVYHQGEIQQVIANAVKWAYVEATSLDAFYAADAPAREGAVGWFGST